MKKAFFLVAALALLSGCDARSVAGATPASEPGDGPIVQHDASGVPASVLQQQAPLLDASQHHGLVSLDRGGDDSDDGGANTPSTLPGHKDDR